MSNQKLTNREKKLIERYGPGGAPQSGTTFFSEYDPLEYLPDDPCLRDDLSQARTRYWTLKRQRQNCVILGGREPVAQKEARDGQPSLPARSPGPNPKKSAAAIETLKGLLRMGRITKPQLLNSVKDGGLKLEDIAKEIGIGRTTVRPVIEAVLADPEFADNKPRQTATKNK